MERGTSLLQILLAKYYQVPLHVVKGVLGIFLTVDFEHLVIFGAVGGRQSPNVRLSPTGMHIVRRVSGTF